MQNLPSILVLRVSRALELRIGLRVKLRAELRAELQGGDPLGPPLRAPFTAWPVHWVGRGAAKPLVELLVELLQSFVRSFVQSVCRAQCFEVRHVDSATTYRAQVFFLTNEKLAWREFEFQDPQPEYIDHSYLGSIKYCGGYKI